MSKASKEREALSESSDGESDCDKEGLMGLVSKRAIRKYYSRRVPPRCCCAQGGCVSVLLLIIAVLLVLVLTLISIVVGLVIAYPRGVVFKGHGSVIEIESVKSGESEDVAWGNLRLSTSVVPQTYDIGLTVDLDSFQVTGSVSIVCDVRNSVDYIALHAKDMTISSHTLFNDSGNLVEYNEVLYPENDFFIFNLTAPQGPGLVIAALNFSYTLRDDLVGFYRSFYTDSDGKKQYLASTQFEATDARRAFPCFDEPSLKANFSLRIAHQARYRAWFNMPVISRTQPDSNGVVTTHFQTSLRMSTYLVAFVVSDFQCVKDTMISISGKEVVVCWHPTFAITCKHYLPQSPNHMLCSKIKPQDSYKQVNINFCLFSAV